MAQTAVVSGVSRRARLASGTALALAGIVVLASGLRLYGLGQESFWVDEAASVAMARLSWDAFWRVVAQQEVNMLLYYAVLREWVAVGLAEGQVRLLSVLAGVAALPALYTLGARLFTARVGLLAALLLGVNGFHVRWSQTARSYALMFLLVTLATLAWVILLDRPTRRAWMGYSGWRAPRRPRSGRPAPPAPGRARTPSRPRWRPPCRRGTRG